MSEQFLPEFLNTYICETYEKYPIGFSTELYNILSDNLLNDNFEILLNNLSVILTDDNIKDLICVCLKNHGVNKHCDKFIGHIINHHFYLIQNNADNQFYINQH